MDEIKLLEVKKEEIIRQSNAEKDGIKKGILVEVNELVSITQKQ